MQRPLKWLGRTIHTALQLLLANLKGKSLLLLLRRHALYIADSVEGLNRTLISVQSFLGLLARKLPLVDKVLKVSSNHRLGSATVAGVG